jgi:uncharacterized protein (TIGR00251 family)
MSSWYRWQDERTVVLELHVQPGARESSLAGRHGDRLKLRIKAPAIDDRANAALIDFLARAMDVPSRQIHLLQGAHGRRKRLLIERPARLLADMQPPPAGLLARGQRAP